MGFLERLTGWLRPGRAARHSKHPLATTQQKPKAESSPVLDRGRPAEAGPGTPPPAGGRDQLVMGVDVGTSLSKVVVSIQGRRVAVSFNAPGGEDNPYLLPTAVTVMPSGECRLGLHDGASERYDDIKRPLIDGKNDERVRLPLTAFMALLFRQVQKKVDEAEGSLLTGRLHWLVNLGLPTTSYGGGSVGEGKDLVGAYRRSAELAWGLVEKMRADRNQGPLTLERCRQAMREAPEKVSERINVFPEVVAQVASYGKSKQRQEGVHVLVDVGGGTLDITVFQVLAPDVKVPIWASTVRPLGMRYLGDWIRMGSNQDLELPPFMHLPSEARVAKECGISLAEFWDIVEPFRRRIVYAVGKTIRKTGTFSLRWPGRLFLVGGGATYKLYMDVARHFEQMEWKFAIRQVPLPRPDDLEAPAIDGACWHRLAVAYGLSFDPFDIGDIEFPEPEPPPGPPPPGPPPRWV